MFFLDIPSVPPQHAQIVIAQSTKQAIERTIGVCNPIENKPESKTSALNDVAPIGAAYSYLTKIEHKIIDSSAFENAKVTILHTPTHGALTQYEGVSSYSYQSANYQYHGSDQATALVEMGSYKIKIVYYFNLMESVPGNSEQGTVFDNRSICPNGRTWRITTIGFESIYVETV